MTSRVFFLMLAVSLILTACQKPPDEAVNQPNTSTDIVRLSPEALETNPLQVTTVESRLGNGTITSTGEIKPDINRQFHISSFVEGRVISDRANLGDYIRQGQTVAVIQNSQVAQIQANYIHELHLNEIETRNARTRLKLAQQTLEREQRLYGEDISPRKDLEVAQNAYELAKSDLEGAIEHATHIRSEARALLASYGLSPGSATSETITTGSPVQALKSGVVIEKNIVLGDIVTPQTMMYTLADLNQVWLDVALYPQDYSHVRLGQVLRFTTDSVPDQVFNGKIDYLPPQASPNTQAFIARAFLDNSKGLLKPGMFGKVAIQTPVASREPFIPEQAVQRHKNEVFVFKVLSSGVYQKQLIIPGRKLAEGYLVSEGLKAGDRVVTEGSFMLKAELLKGELGEAE